MDANSGNAPLSPDLETLVRSLQHTPEAVAQKTRGIYAAAQRDRGNLHAGNFTTLGSADLAHLFGLYDSGFFGGSIAATLRQHGDNLTFRVAPRMTRAGGKTYFTERPLRQGGTQAHFEIAISAPLLFQSFRDVDRVIRINGFVCADRLEALQRIVEHELLHLVEMMVWGKSSCSAPNYQNLALRTFAHTEFTHDLVTQRERAQTKFDVRVGDAVQFEHEGRHYTGKVNRITRRATILVEDARGTPYSDGKRYLKFYVPLGMLRKTKDEG